MSDYVLSCCSTVDLTREKLESRGIRWLPFHFELNGVDHLDDFGETMSYQDFYDAMEAGSSTKTSQINVKEYEDYFEEIVSEGHDILHISFSSGLSGTVNSATLAATHVMEAHPERKIIVVDSLCASSGYGLLMIELADMRDEGKSMEELAKWTQENRLRMHHWFFSTDLSAYVRGGRISKTAGLVGTALKICPLLNMDYLGRLAPREKIRSKKKTMHRAVEMMKEHAEGGTSYSGKAYICNSACLNDAKVFSKMISDEFPNIDGEIEIYPIGTTIGSHTGKGTLSVFFWGDERRD